MNKADEIVIATNKDPTGEGTLLANEVDFQGLDVTYMIEMIVIMEILLYKRLSNK